MGHLFLVYCSEKFPFDDELGGFAGRLEAMAPARKMNSSASSPMIYEGIRGPDGSAVGRRDF